MTRQTEAVKRGCAHGPWVKSLADPHDAVCTLCGVLLSESGTRFPVYVRDSDDVPVGTFVVGGYPNEEAPAQFLCLQFRDVEAAKRLAKMATDAVGILESGKGAAYTHFAIGTWRPWSSAK